MIMYLTWKNFRSMNVNRCGSCSHLLNSYPQTYVQNTCYPFTTLSLGMWHRECMSTPRFQFLKLYNLQYPQVLRSEFNHPIRSHSSTVFCLGMFYATKATRSAGSSIRGRQSHPRLSFSTSSDVLHTDPVPSSAVLDDDFMDDMETSENDDDDNVMLSTEEFLDRDDEIDSAFVQDDDDSGSPAPFFQKEELATRVSHTSPSNTAINHGNVSILPTVGYVPRRASLVEIRVATQQLPYMEEITRHVVGQKSFKTVEINKETIRVAFLYWISRPVRDMFFNEKGNPEIPLQGADQILHWLMHQFDHVAEGEQEKRLVASSIEYILGNSTNLDESRNAGMCRLMSLFSQPLQGTHAALKGYGRRTDDNASRQLACLLAASRVCNIMQRIHNDNTYFPYLHPDGQSYQSILNLYAKRCKLLVLLGPPPRTEGSHFPRIRRGVRWSSPDTVQALGGCGSTRECISAAKLLIDQMKNDPKSPNPSSIHYSLLLSMMSSSSVLNLGMADEAYTLLQQVLADPSIEECVFLYNSVLLAYVLEAAEYKKKNRWEQQESAQRKCELLWDHMRMHQSAVIAADPITYSIMLKLYRNVDQAETARTILEEMEASAVSRSSLASSNPDNIASSIMTDTVPGHRLPPDPSLMHYNAVLNAWSKSSNPQSGDLAMALVRRMEEQRLAKSGLPHPIVPRPDHVSLTTALDALLRGPNVEDVEGMIAHMEQILNKFESCEEADRRPDAVTYNVIFHTLFRRATEQTEPHLRVQIANEMEHLFYRLKNHSSNFRATAGKRIFRYYNECLRVWASTNSREGAERAMRLFRDMYEAHRSGAFPSARPNGTSYQFLFESISLSDDAEYIKACRELFLRMEEANVPVTVSALMIYLGRLLRCRFEGTVDEADDAFVETLMERLRAKLTRDDGFTAGWVMEGIFSHITKETDLHLKAVWARRAEKVFRALLKEPQYFRFTEGQKMTFYYNNCIKVWAFARTPDSTANALRLLYEMEDSSRGIDYDPNDVSCCLPDSRTYEYILTCLTRYPDAISVKTAREVFQKMEIGNIPITLSILNRFIRILSNSGVQGSLFEAERILKAVEDDFLAGNEGSLCPNNLSYSSIVEGHMKTLGGLRDAERILDHMNALSKQTGNSDLLPSPKLYLDLMNIWSESVAVDAIERVDSLFHKMAEIAKPSSYEYAALQAAWGRSKRPDAPQQVESILVLMQEEYEKGNNPSARPAIENFDLVIKTWATSNQEGSIERASAILRRLEELCYSNRGPYTDMRPSTSCYQHALVGWTLSDSPNAGERALDLLDRMKHYQDAARGAPSINQADYHHTMAAIGKSSISHKALKCYEIVKEMRIAYDTRRNRYSWPTHETFKSILGVCACCIQSPEEKSEALQVCVKAMKDYVQLPHLGSKIDVYVQFLYAVFRLLPPGEERDQVVLSIFADEQYKCPAGVFDSFQVRDGLLKTVSQKAFADIARSCGRNPLLKTLMNNRIRGR